MEIRTHKSIIEIDLVNKTAVKKVSGDLWNTVGGVVMAYKLMQEYIEDDPLIIVTGPLNGYFPYLSKALIVYMDHGEVIEKFGGGNISAKMNMAGIDAIVITGAKQYSGYVNINIYENTIHLGETISELKNTSSFSNDLFITPDSLMSQGYFSFGDVSGAKLIEEGSVSINIEYSEDIFARNVYDYEKLYKSLLDSYKELTVDPANNPSCMGCPMGCEKSSIGEDTLNISILPRCLISCGYAATLYKQIPIVFACLQSIGYDYTHRELEQLPEIFSKIKESISLYTKNV